MSRLLTLGVALAAFSAPALAQEAIATAPADRRCSHSGILGCGAARLTTPMTTGARLKRERSIARSSSLISPFSSRARSSHAFPRCRQ